MFTHTVICPYCNSSVKNNWAKYVSNSEVIDEREMGDETEHTIECDSFKCPTCNKDFRVRGSIFEYPPGAFNDVELHCEELDEELEDDEEENDEVSVDDKTTETETSLKSMNDLINLKSQAKSGSSYSNQYDYMIAALANLYISKLNGTERIYGELENWDSECKSIIANDLINELKVSGVMGFNPAEILKLI